jgi:DNA-binding CsgD family transcriptional regulator
MTPHSQLTPLERRCLSLVAFGKSAVEIGRVVGATEREVDTLLFCTQRKLGAANRLQAVAKGMSLGLIDASLAG